LGGWVGEWLGGWVVDVKEAVPPAEPDDKRLLERVEVDASEVDGGSCAARGEDALAETAEPLEPGVARESLGVPVGVRIWRDEPAPAALPEVVDVQPWWRLGVTVAVAALHRNHQPNRVNRAEGCVRLRKRHAPALKSGCGGAALSCFARPLRSRRRRLAPNVKVYLHPVSILRKAAPTSGRRTDSFGLPSLVTGFFGVEVPELSGR
jgi:hypothetical protein